MSIQSLSSSARTFVISASASSLRISITFTIVVAGWAVSWLGSLLCGLSVPLSWSLVLSPAALSPVVSATFFPSLSSSVFFLWFGGWIWWCAWRTLRTRTRAWTFFPLFLSVLFSFFLLFLLSFLLSFPFLLLFSFSFSFFFFWFLSFFVTFSFFVALFLSLLVTAFSLSLLVTSPLLRFFLISLLIWESGFSFELIGFFER